jgi:adenylate kinase family enzyme
VSAPLGPADPLPHRPRRILVAGTSGSGTSTLARALSARLDVPHHELDALHHGPGRVPRPSFVEEVTALAATGAWVTEWQYSAVRPLLLSRADLLVWLDLTRRRVARQLVPRTLRRRWRRTPLWNGNVEPPLRTLFTDPDHLWRWARRTHPHHADRVRAVLTADGGPVVVRLRGPAEVRTRLAGPVADRAGPAR